MESTLNDETEVSILDYALMLLKSTENLKNTLETLTEEMQKNKPNVTPSEVKLKENKIKKATSMMKIMQKLRRKKKKDGAKSSGSSVNIIKGQKNNTTESSHKLKKNASNEPIVESLIKTDIFHQITPKPSVVQKSEFQLARKTVSRPNASVKSNVNSNYNLTRKTLLESSNMHFDDSLFNAFDVLISVWLFIKNQLL